MSTVPAAALERLRNGGTDRLADLLLDDILNRPVSELVDPTWLSRQLTALARTAARDKKLEDLFRARLNELRKQVPRGHLPIPDSVRKPLDQVVGRPYRPDRLIVGRILDHDTVRVLLKSTFQDMLVGFARKLKPVLPSKPPGGLPLGRLSKLSETVMGAVGQELEAHVEERAREFMEAGVQRLVHAIADHVCDARYTREYGEWRVYALDVLLSTDMRVLAGELEKLDPDALVSTGVAMVRGIVERPELEGEITGLVKAALKEAGEDQSIRGMLFELGPELFEQGLTAMRDLFRARARAVVETPAFGVWWAEIIEGQAFVSEGSIAEGSTSETR